MRISFDIDDTIIFYDKSRNGKDRLINGEYLRHGTLDLFKKLHKEHELFLYTASLRNPMILKLAFRLKGIKLKGVINQDEHEELRKSSSIRPFPSKYPSRFGIDLHFDNSAGVKLEGEKHGFNVVVIDEYDEEWTTRVLDEVFRYKTD